MVVQQVYRGWALLGIVLVAAVLSNAVLAIPLLKASGTDAFRDYRGNSSGDDPDDLLELDIPGESSDRHWSVAPQNWEALRIQWEYSHAANAVLTFLALCATAVSSLSWLE